jgi:hypothetical protein
MSEQFSLWLENRRQDSNHKRIDEMEVLVVADWTAGSVCGWSWSICPSSPNVWIDDCADVCAESACTWECNDLEYSPDMAALIPPAADLDFMSVRIHEDRVTQHVQLAASPQTSLPARDRFEMLSVTYSHEFMSGDAALEFCNLLGPPAVDTVFVVDSSSVDDNNFVLRPARQDDLVVEWPGPEDFALWLEPVSSSGRDHEIVVVGSWPDGPAGGPHKDICDGVQGWSWGLCHNSQEASIGHCAGLAADGCDSLCPNITCPEDIRTPGPQGEPVSFYCVNVYENGVIQGIVLDYQQEWELDNIERFEMLKVKYELALGVDSTRLDFCPTLGSPPVEVTYVVRGMSIIPATQEGLFIGEGLFKRGDVNADERLNIADTICILAYLFNPNDVECSHKVQSCYDAADVNDDGNINIADPIDILIHLFVGGVPLPPPFGECGSDPTGDILTCESFGPCQ